VEEKRLRTTALAEHDW